MRYRRGFTLLEVLAALAILAVVVGAFLSINSENLRKHAISRRAGVASALAREKLSELMLAAPPTEAMTTPWAPFLDEAGQERESQWRWRQTVAEDPFVPPGLAEPVGAYSGWTITVEVSTTDDPEGKEAISVSAKMEIPQAGAGQ